jgi:Holliday junction resolvasome RuvABC endonuclease subunit
VRAPKQEFCVVVSAASEVTEPHDVGPHQPSQTTVLALDLGTTTGWALRPRDGNTAHGFVSFKTQRFEGGGMRYLRFKRWLTEMKALAGDIHAVYFEEIRRHAGVDAAHVYGGLMATLTTWCEHHNIPYQGVPVGTIKKHATGKGNASKDEVIAAMRALGHPVTDDNEADALAILHWAIDTQGENT